MNGEVIRFPIIREKFTEDEQRYYLIVKLEDLLWNDMDALFQLDNYCLNRRNRVNKRVENLLINMGILAKDGTLPDRTNEAMYELRTGYKPFWLNKNRPR